jgi:hypothetical protein
VERKRIFAASPAAHTFIGDIQNAQPKNSQANN